MEILHFYYSIVNLSPTYAISLDLITNGEALLIKNKKVYILVSFLETKLMEKGKDYFFKLIQSNTNSLGNGKMELSQKETAKLAKMANYLLNMKDNSKISNSTEKE